MSTKYCRHCGKPIPEDSKYCPNCGTVLNEYFQKESEKKPAQVYAILAFWMIQVYLAYTKRPYRFNRELFLIGIGLIFSLLIYMIFRKKTGTLLISFFSIAVGLLAYIFTPIVLSTLNNLQSSKVVATTTFVQDVPKVPTETMSLKSTETRVTDNTPTPDVILTPFYQTQTAIGSSWETGTRVPTKTPVTRLDGIFSEVDIVGTFVAQDLGTDY